MSVYKPPSLSSPKMFLEHVLDLLVKLLATVWFNLVQNAERGGAFVAVSSTEHRYPLTLCKNVISVFRHQRQPPVPSSSLAVYFTDAVEIQVWHRIIVAFSVDFVGGTIRNQAISSSACSTFGPSKRLFSSPLEYSAAKYSAIFCSAISNHFESSSSDSEPYVDVQMLSSSLSAAVFAVAFPLPFCFGPCPSPPPPFAQQSALICPFLVAVMTLHIGLLSLSFPATFGRACICIECNFFCLFGPGF